MKKAIFQKIGLMMLTSCLLVITGCSYNYSSAQTTKDVRELPSFNSIALSMSGHVFLTQGKTQKIEIEAEKNILPYILTEVRGDELIIKTENGTWRNMGTVNIYITIPEISALSVAGSGKIVCKNRLETNAISLNVSGSGSLEIPSLKAQRIESKISGSGSIDLSGEQTSFLEAYISGSGNLDAVNLPAGTVEVKISGSGNARVHATEKLDSAVAGSGNVHYKGNPRINANSTGSGKTVHMN